jgi:hypothetical protein
MRPGRLARYGGVLHYPGSGGELPEIRLHRLHRGEAVTHGDGWRNGKRRIFAVFLQPPYHLPEVAGAREQERGEIFFAARHLGGSGNGAAGGHDGKVAFDCDVGGEIGVRGVRRGETRSLLDDHRARVRGSGEQQQPNAETCAHHTSYPV